MSESKDLVVAEQKPPEVHHFEMQQRMANLFALSGCFADVKSANQQQAVAQAFVKIALGESMGFSPAASMSGIDLIQGRPAIGSNLRAARMKKAGYTWKILRLDDTGCEMEIYFRGELQGPVAYTKTDADRAGLSTKDNWKKNPSAMYFARAITTAQRRYAPEVLEADLLDTNEAREVVEVDIRGQGTMATATNAKLEELKTRLNAAKAVEELPIIDVSDATEVGEG